MGFRFKKRRVLYFLYFIVKKSDKFMSPCVCLSHIIELKCDSLRIDQYIGGNFLVVMMMR